ncbi:MAG: hypothetical protein EOO92_26400 [Pedobacter sp.]|nr:MAG: hypothetical protein EOO92_26400 [Pedobacter sp.]
MKKTKLTFVMATLCLNFAYSQNNQQTKAEQAMKVFKYGFCGYKSGYKPGVKISNDLFAKGKMITVRNLPIVQLYAIALSLGKQICENQIVLDVRDPKKLWELRCYQLIVPANQVDNFWVTMHQNLNLEFPDYVATMEMRNNIMHLVITDKDDQL